MALPAMRNGGWMASRSATAEAAEAAEAAKEVALLRLRLMLGRSLVDRHTSASAGEQHRSARLVDLADDLAGIHLHRRQ